MSVIPMYVDDEVVGTAYFNNSSNETPPDRIPVDTESNEGKYKVAEIFGPTIQGEGPDAGRPCYFVRLGACDYRCSWCDSMHAVLPQLVRKLPWMSGEEIVDRLNELEGDHALVIISGGNPVMWDCSDLIDELEADPSRDWEIAVETQGSLYKEWLQRVDRVIVSPKPPSSGMITDYVKLTEFSNHFTGWTDLYWKVVMFSSEDLAYAMDIQERYHIDEIYLSIGTNSTDTRDTLLDRYKDAIEDTLRAYIGVDASFKISPQMHVLAFGHVLGV